MTGNVKYQIIESDEFSGATVFIDGDTYPVDQTHPSYQEIVDLLRAKTGDAESLLDLIHPAQGIANTLQRLSDRASFAAGTLYFDGDVIEGALVDHIVRLIEGGKDDKEKGYPAFVALLERLATNPSKKSRKHLFHFIETHGITIHPTGKIVLYKGVKADGGSINAGYGIVDGKVYGEIDPDTKRVTKAESLPNHVGAVVEIPRSLVDDDRSVGCSTGLHAGTFAYASGFAQGQLLTVLVDPRDVVSVPSDVQNSKVRVCRYEVLEINKREYTEATFPVEEEDEFNYDESDLDFEEEESDEDADADEPEVKDETVSDDDLAEALRAGTSVQDDSDEDGDSFTVTVTVTRDSKGRYVKGAPNPGQTQPRDAKGHYLPRS